MPLTDAAIGPRAEVRGPIAGVGVDLVDLRQFAEQWAQPGTRFGEVFTPGERRDARSGSAEDVVHLAARWAAKEAFIKAWSATLFSQPPPLGEQVHRDIEVVLDAWRRPRLRLHGEVAALTGRYEVHLSLSHDGDAAIAYVVLAHPADTSLPYR